MKPSAEAQFEAGIFALTAEGWTIVKRRTFTAQFPAAQRVQRNSATLARKNSPRPIRGSVVELGTWLTLEWVLADYEQKRKAGNPEFNEPETQVFTMGGKITVSYTTRQGEYLSFIQDYTKLNGQPPAEADMQRHFKVSPPSVHDMILMLEKKGFIQRTPGMARSIRLLLPPDKLSREESAKGFRSSKPESILGHWRITQMEMWDQDFVDAEVEGYVRLDDGGSGEFQFGYVHGLIDHELTERDGRPATEWTWEGNDEMDPASGRGWAALQDDGTIKGKLSFHHGDKSGFVAIRKGTTPRRTANR
jgi:hypothetical protein